MSSFSSPATAILLLFVLETSRVILFSLSSFIMLIWLVFIRTPSSEFPVGWTSLVVVIIFFGGVQLLALGLIGEYLGRTYLLSNNHPQFSIKESKNIKFKD